MIEVKDLKKEYTGFSLNVSLTAEKGKITGLIGQNGAGKSTLFKSILSLVYPASGTIRVFGKDVSSLSEADRQRLGTVMADSTFSGWLTISQVRKILPCFYPSFEEDKFTEGCRKAGLSDDKKINELSTGMKAKLKVLTALTHKADVLILDEPTAGLDVIARDEVLEMIRDYMIENPDACILISSHISTDLESLCDDFCKRIEGITGMKVGPRFSAGYGDLTLDLQASVFRELSLTKHLGVTLNSSMLMTPTKSVTAIVAIRPI
jgi:ABC-2 type transport system ATP-binding protein